MSIHGDVRYSVTHKLELTKSRLLRWNRFEVGDIFRRIEWVEADIAELQQRKDQEGGLHELEMGEL